MDGSRFDALTRRVTTRLTRRTSLGVLAGATLPLLGLNSASDAKKRKKITLCVNGQTVKKPKQKARKLQKKGATKGACVLLRCGNGGPCTVFLTAVGFTGSEVGGLAGADAKCTSLANGAGIAGTFKAWLSTNNQTPATRFDNIDRAGPWVLPKNVTDGASTPPMVANDFPDLTTCGATCLQNAINRDQNGVTPPGSLRVWTATNSDGTADPANCTNFTSDAGFGVFGDGTKNDADWTDSNSALGCASELGLYCFQQAT